MEPEKKIYCPLQSHPQSDGMCSKEKCRWWSIPGDCCVIEQIADIFFDIHNELELLRKQR